MAATYASRRLRQLRATEARLTAAHRALAQDAGRLVVQAATARNEGDAVVPNTRAARVALSGRIWAQVVKPFYIGPGLEALVGPQPQSPYARLLVDGIRGAVRLQAERQQAIVRRLVRDEAVYAWLTGPRAALQLTEQRGVYDPFHEWVDPNGYRLSDRIWRAGIDVRANIDGLLAYHIQEGTSAVRIAELLEDYLTPGSSLIRTRTPYGREGSYAARRLARTEITAAAGRGTVNAAIANPYVRGVQWQLSRSHRETDQCDANARGGPNGDGIYPPDQVPRYPDHPNELCTLVPVPVEDADATTSSLRREMLTGSRRGRLLQGMMNVAWLTEAILLGVVHELIARLQETRERRQEAA